MNTETKTFNAEDISVLISMMSDIQEEVSNRHVQGKLNLIKGVLMQRVTIKHDGLFASFENVNPESRICDKCGLLRVGEYKQCQCPCVCAGMKGDVACFVCGKGSEVRE